MLLNISSINEAGRTFSCLCWAPIGSGEICTRCNKAQARANLLTPVTKAFMTDRGLDACVTAQQVFGGHGYIREWGMEQLVRDVRIAQIYEGTNGIQAADFMLRKVASDQGAVLFDLIRELSVGLAGSASKQINAAAQRFESATLFLIREG